MQIRQGIKIQSCVSSFKDDEIDLGGTQKEKKSVTEDSLIICVALFLYLLLWQRCNGFSSNYFLLLCSELTHEMSPANEYRFCCHPPSNKKWMEESRRGFQ